MSKQHKKGKHLHNSSLYTLPAYSKCDHCEWITCGPYNLLLKSWSTHIPTTSLDVFIDLSGYEGRDIPSVPEHLQQYMPPDTPSSYALVTWKVEDGYTDERVVGFAINMLNAGLRVGFGCHGGHGRTGWLAARLVKHFEQVSGDEAVRLIRERYCGKAVETHRQCDDLGCLHTQPAHVTGAVTYHANTTPYVCPACAKSYMLCTCDLCDL